MLYWSVIEQGDFLSRHCVPVWKMNYIGSTLMSLYLTIATPSHAFQFLLCQQVEWFVQQEMGLLLIQTGAVSCACLSFGDVDNRMTGLLAVQAMTDGKENTLVKLLKLQQMDNTTKNQIFELVHGIKEEAMAAGREIQKRKAEDDMKLEVKKLRAMENLQQSLAAAFVTPDKVVCTDATMANVTMEDNNTHNNNKTEIQQLPEVTPDLKHWRKQ
ncbi:hypothetical protein ACA910_016849 [Epithemia clementina (nom. ined.)]